TGAGRSRPPRSPRGRERVRSRARRLGAEGFQRCRHCHAALDVGAEIGKDELDGSDLRRDVEDVEPADVTEAEDLSLQLTLAVRDRDPEAVADAPDDVAGVDPGWGADRGHDGAPVLVRREELEPERLHACAG